MKLSPQAQAKVEELAQAHYDRRAELFDVDDFSREVIATESFMLGAKAGYAFARDEDLNKTNKLISEIRKGLPSPSMDGQASWNHTQKIVWHAIGQYLNQDAQGESK